jgi:hypothetical protein
MNWINTGNNDWFKVRRSDGKFEVKIDPYLFKKMKFHDAADHSASLINQKWGHVYVALSGGYDSEYVCEVFQRTGFPYTPVIIDIGINYDEIIMAFDWCEKNSVTPIIHKMSEEDYYKASLKYLFKTNLANTFGVFPLIVAEIVKDKNGKVLTGMDDPWTSENDIDILLPQDLQIDDASYLLDILYPGQHPGGFFTYSLEFFYALISEADYTVNRGIAKNKLYNLYHRDKIVPNERIKNFEFFSRTRHFFNLRNSIKTSCVIGHKDLIIKELEKFIV